MLITLMLTQLAAAQDAPPIINGEETSDFAPVGTLATAYNNTLYGSFCSGTLATPDGVITAAHCAEAAIDSANQGYDIYFCTGTSIYSSSGLDECSRAVEVAVHPDYSRQTLQADIAVLLLEDRLVYSGTYALNADSPSTFTDATVTYVGWGSNSGYGNPNGVGVKRTVDIDIFDYDYNFLYTYAEGKNVCSGDSGGAALMWDGSRWELVGVNSFVYSSYGDGCTGREAYAGAVRVDAYYEWIASIIDLSDTNEDPEEEEEDPVEEEEEEEAPIDEEDPADEDTAAGDTAAGGDPVDDGGGGVSGIGCSSAPLRAGGLLGLSLLGAALATRRRLD